MDSLDTLATRMSEVGKSPQRHRSDSSLEDATTLNDDARGYGELRRPTEDRETIIDPEKRPETALRRASQASYLEDPEAHAPSLTASQTAAASFRGPKVVPPSERRGWFARLVLIPEVEEPKDYERSTKWIITFVIAMGGVASPFGSSIIFRKGSE